MRYSANAQQDVTNPGNLKWKCCNSEKLIESSILFNKVLKSLHLFTVAVPRHLFGVQTRIFLPSIHLSFCFILT